MDNQDEKMHSLMARAIFEAAKAQRSDVVETLCRITCPIAIIKDPESKLIDAVGEHWDKLRPQRLHQNDVGRMLNYDLYKISPGYRTFLSMLPTHTNAIDQKISAITMLINSGYHESACLAVSKAGLQKEVKDHIDNEIKARIGFYDNGESALIHMLGSRKRWDQNTYNLLDQLDIDLPLDHSIINVTSPNEWTPERLAWQVSRIGQLCDQKGLGLPVVRLTDGRLIVTHGKELVNAFVEQCDAFSIKGMSGRDFPKYIACRFNKKDTDALMEVGAIPISAIEPSIDSDYIRRGYTSDTGIVDEEHIAVSLAMMSTSAVSNSINNREPLMLVPYDVFAPESEVDKDLLMAFRYYRAEPISTAVNSENRNKISFERFTKVKLYLYEKGMSFKNEAHTIPDCYYYVDSLEDLTHLTHDVDKYYLDKLFSQRPVNNDIYPMRGFNFFQNSEDIDSEIVRLFLEKEKISRYLGKDPSIVLHGSLGFLNALSYFEQKIEINAINLLEDIKNPNKIIAVSFASQMYSHHRLCARLGVGRKLMESWYGADPQQLLAKAAKVKDPSIKECVLGLLDSYDLIDVLKSAKTQPQLDFVIQNYDVGSVLNDLPVGVQKKVAPKLLINKFSYSECSL